MRLEEKQKNSSRRMVMNNNEKLGRIFDELANELNITNTMLEKAETAYSALGEYIRSSNQEWDVSVYPQGSFELGTVVKPLNEDQQYDVDLVVLVKDPILNAKTLRVNIRNLLMNHGRYVGKIEDKKPCIRIQYAESSQFHMDVACAIDGLLPDTNIEISRLEDQERYYFETSNPKGYVDWFKTKMSYQKVFEEYRSFQHKAETEIEELKLTSVRTPLQKAVQILKRHRDIYFSNQDDDKYKPSSIIITTLCSLSYNYSLSNIEHKGNIYLTIKNMLDQFQNFISFNMTDGYVLSNPSQTDENFLKKWKFDVQYKIQFDKWLNQARKDIILNPETFIESSIEKLSESIYKSFGKEVGTEALKRYGERIGLLANSGALKFDKENGKVSTNLSDATYKKHTYFGGISEKA